MNGEMRGLPEGWTTTTLEQLGSWGSGGTPSRSITSHYENGTIPWLVIGDLNDGIVTQAAQHITEAAVASSSAKLVPANSVLIAMYGSIGKLGITGMLCTTNQAIAFCVPDDHITSSRLLFYLLMGQKTSLISQGKGGAQQNISQTVLKSHKVALAPLAEQKVIADMLDALLAQVDTLKARLDEIPAILKRFRQSVLSAAVTGKLTEEWRRTKQKGEQSILVEWKTISLGERVKNFDYQRQPISSSLRESRQGDYPYFGASGQIDTIDGYTHDGDYVLIGEDGANLLARSKPIAFLASGKIWVNNHAHVLSCGSFVENQFFAYHINSIDLTPWVSGTAQPKLNQANMNKIPVPVPTLIEQTEIVRRVESLFVFADQIEARAQEAAERVKHLTQSILVKAFRGELTEEWRKAHPELVTGQNSAEALLERIRAARAAAPEAKGKRGPPLSNEKNLVSNSSEKFRTHLLSGENRMSKSRSDEDVNGKAYLAGCLASLGGQAKVEALYQASDLTLPDFYKQLAWEVSKGKIKDLKTMFEAV